MRYVHQWKKDERSWTQEAGEKKTEELYSESEATSKRKNEEVKRQK